MSVSFNHRHAACAAVFVTALALAACEESLIIPGPPPGPLADEFAFVTTTDFTTGSSSVIWLDTTLTTTQNVAPVHSDAVARCFDGLVYVVNRMNGDNIQILDPSQGFNLVRQFSVGNGSDPHDILLLSRQRALVTRYNETAIWIVDPTQGRKVGDIDLAWAADGDGIPEMDRMVHAGNYIFVSVQRLDRDTDWGPVGNSYLVVIDARTYQFVDADPLQPGPQPLRLAGTNPNSELVLDPNGRIQFSSVGRYGIADGGIERVDADALDTMGFILEEAAAGGDVTDVVMIDADRGAAIVSDANFNNLLIGFTAGSADIDTLYAPGSFALQDAELSPDGLIYLTDRTPVAPGIRVFRADTGSQVTTSPIDVGLPPFDIQFGRR
jgi:hypothetical protein